MVEERPPIFGFERHSLGARFSGRLRRCFTFTEIIKRNYERGYWKGDSP
jgi:hypothetical protein